MTNARFYLVGLLLISGCSRPEVPTTSITSAPDLERRLVAAEERLQNQEENLKDLMVAIQNEMEAIKHIHSSINSLGVAVKANMQSIDNLQKEFPTRPGHTDTRR